MSRSTFDTAGFELIKSYLRFFDPLVLESYRSQPDKYEILFDDFDGVIRTTEMYYLELEKTRQTETSIEIRFGRIILQNGNSALVIWLPDLLKSSKQDRDKWFGFIISNPKISITDEGFFKWYSRNIEARLIEMGPTCGLSEVIQKINQLTNKSVCKPLYLNEVDITLTYPNAENTHKYQDSHQDLYRYLLDGLNKNCIDDIATKLSINVQSGDKTTFNGLLKIFPQLNVSRFKDAMDKVSEQRRLASHKVRSPAKKFGAFEQFKFDLIDCNNGLEQLFQILKSNL